MAEQRACHCPDIDDQDWHMKDMDWSNKFFYFDDLPHFFNVPLGFERVVGEMKNQIARKGYTMVNPDLILHLPALFQGKVLVEIEDPQQYDANIVPFENARILTRVYQGSRAGLKQAVEELKAFAQDRTHILPNAIYHWHITCAQCAKERGGEKTVLLAQI